MNSLTRQERQALNEMFLTLSEARESIFKRFFILLAKKFKLLLS